MHERPAASAERFVALLKTHTDCVNAEASQKGEFLGELLRCYQAAYARWATAQKATADDFNLFEALDVAYDEVRHSKMLAWLLDRRIEYGTHAQGNLGFRLFLEEFGSELGVETNPQVKTYCDNDSYWVKREVTCWVKRELTCEESRVDIEIAAYKKFVIHIENKIRASEGPDQTCREWRALQDKAKELQVPRENCHALFLTLDGCQPISRDFRPIGWRRIATVLDRFAQLAEPPDVKLFTRHYAAAIRKLAVAEPEAEEVENAEAMAE